MSYPLKYSPVKFSKKKEEIWWNVSVVNWGFYLQGTCPMTSNLCFSSYEINLQGVYILSRVADYLQTSKNACIATCIPCFASSSQTLDTILLLPEESSLSSFLNQLPLSFQNSCICHLFWDCWGGLSYIILKHFEYASLTTHFILGESS